MGLILTLDWSFSHGRDWGSPAIPEQLDLKTMVKFAPEVLHAAALAVRVGADRAAPRPHRAEHGGARRARADVLRRLRRVDADAAADLGRPAWLREQWDGPFMLKGVMRVDDAKRAVDAGFDAISVSNHGGNNLDGTPASIRALPAIAEAVGDQIEVLLDGGIRRGSDVVKAVALGAERS